MCRWGLISFTDSCRVNVWYDVWCVEERGVLQTGFPAENDMDASLNTAQGQEDRKWSSPLL